MPEPVDRVQDDGGAKQMRVVAGSAGGLRLKAVPGRGTRPTTDRVKESVFGILGERCFGARILDLFAGTGSLGIEALSRGGERALFVEKDPAAARILRENLRTTGFAGAAGVMVKDVTSALRALVRQGDRPFNLVLLDPPYGTGLLPVVMERLGAKEAPLSAGALVVAEHSNHEVPPDVIGGLGLIRREKYGETVVSFYRCEVRDCPADDGTAGGVGEGGGPGR